MAAVWPSAGFSALAVTDAPEVTSVPCSGSGSVGGSVDDPTVYCRLSQEPSGRDAHAEVDAQVSPSCAA
ncbi:hypothetical protein Q9Q99_05390 [Curtobacterium flaccumfaciens]|nr:hypothetical protein Q9Q99_05390 [Curtobacterium flaccumfaciens]